MHYQYMTLYILTIPSSPHFVFFAYNHGLCKDYWPSKETPIFPNQPLSSLLAPTNPISSVSDDDQWFCFDYTSMLSEPTKLIFDPTSDSLFSVQFLIERVGSPTALDSLFGLDSCDVRYIVPTCTNKARNIHWIIIR